MNNYIKYFKSNKTGKDIALNTNTRELAIIKNPSKIEIEELLTNHEKITLSEIWDKRLGIQKDNCNYLEAFSTTTTGSFVWILQSAINKNLNTSKIRGLATEIQNLPISSQKKLLEKIRPTTRQDFEKISTARGIKDLIGDDLRKLLLEHENVESFIQSLFKRASNQKTSIKTRSGEAEKSIELLILMRKHGYVLLPLSFRTWASSVKWRVAINPVYSPNYGIILDEISKLLARPNYDLLVSYGRSCLLMSSIESTDDLSGPLIDEIENLILSVIKSPAHAHKITSAFVELWNDRYPNEPFQRSKFLNNNKNSDLLRTRGEFGWLVNRNPDFFLWQTPLSNYIAQRNSTSKQAVVADLNYFCDFLVIHPNPPLAPEQTKRVEHIRDVTFKNPHTFMSHLEKSPLNSKRRSRILSYLRDFFDWHQDWLMANDRKEESEGFHNPISTQDNFQANTSAGQTFRTALPSWLLREFRKTLTTNDFEIAKGTKRGHGIQDEMLKQAKSSPFGGQALQLS